MNQMNGTVQSGGTDTTLPLAGVSVTLYEATTDSPLAVGTATTDADGKFSLDISPTASDGIFYATASLGGGGELVTIIGPNIPASITINELTTVAAAFSMAQFTQNGVIAGDAFGLRIASGMNDNLVSPLTGASSDVLVKSPSGDETNSLRSTRSLANLLAACVQKQPGAVETLFKLTTPPGGTAPNDTLQALVNICLYPAKNVAEIYNAQAAQMYLPALQQITAPFQQMPDAWTIAVKVNNSGDSSRLFGGPGNLVFDQNGYAWITNNVYQGKPTSADYNIVLQPNGKPADGENGTPTSPISGGGILGGGFGIEIDTRGSVWMGNFGWGGDNPTPPPKGNASVSQFNGDGTPISGDQGGGVNRAQGIVSDLDNNIWIASNESNQVFVFPNGDPKSSFSYPVDAPDPVPDGEEGPFDIALAPDGSGAWVTYSGGLAAKSAGGVSKYFIEDGAIKRQFKVERKFQSLKGMSLDSQGNAWIASGGEGVYLVSPDGTDVKGPFTGGGINGPWSVTVDGDDNVWVANFGPMLPGSVYGNDGTNAVKVVKAAISKLAGAKNNLDLKAGAAISPDTYGYTLPSAGDPVLLNNQPLYGARGPAECFSPLMRQTNCLIDQAGNVWALNNWKPDFNVDTLSDDANPPNPANPGGDGVVIFVGLAKPPIKKH